MSGETSVTIDFDVRVPMPDGVELAADLYRPARAGPASTVLLRTPYDRSSGASTGQQVGAARLASRGYAVLIQDVRGRHGSSGEFNPFLNEGRDGHDTINWIADQPWSNGKVGMVGTSYAGYAQVRAARELPENLKAWVPGMTCLDARQDWVFQGDAFCLGFNLSWALGVILAQDHRLENRSAVVAALEEWSETIKTSVSNLAVLKQPAARWILDWFRRRDDEAFWGARSGKGVALSAAPSLQIGGWFDLFANGTFALHDELKAGAAGDCHQLIVGPWDHSPLPLGTGSGVSDFGPAAALDLFGVQCAWFDWLLREESEPDFPPARVFLTGGNRWENLDCWPPRGQEVQFFLAPNGALSETGGCEGLKSFEVDPDDTTPTVGGRLCCAPYLLRPGQCLQNGREQRTDVVRFCSEPSIRERAFLGPVSAQIWSASNQTVSDVHVTLVNMTPDGRDLYLADSIQRLRAKAEELVRFDIDLGHIGHLLRPGHRIAVDIAGAAFPRFDLAHSHSISAHTLAFGGAFPSSLSVHEVL